MVFCIPSLTVLAGMLWAQKIGFNKTDQSRKPRLNISARPRKRLLNVRCSPGPTNTRQTGDDADGQRGPSRLAPSFRPARRSSLGRAPNQHYHKICRDRADTMTGVV